MEERVLKERGDQDIATVKELNLDNCKSSNVTGLSEDWKSLEKLNLINVGLTTLKGFPRLPNLKKLELSDNNLCEGFDALACLPKLEEVNLSGNKIKDTEAFEPFAQINTLKKLSLFGCDVCKTEDYRKKMFELIPSLVYLDGMDKKQSPEINGTDGGNGKEEEELEDSDSEEDDDSDDGEFDEEEDEEDIPLEALYGKINEEGDDEDFEGGEEDDDDDDIEEEEDEDDDVTLNLSKEGVEGMRGTKRKHEEEEQK